MLPYSVENAENELPMFVGAKWKDSVVVEGGEYYLSANHPKEVDAALIDFVKK